MKPALLFGSSIISGGAVVYGSISVQREGTIKENREIEEEPVSDISVVTPEDQPILPEQNKIEPPKQDDDDFESTMLYKWIGNLAKKFSWLCYEGDCSVKYPIIPKDVKEHQSWFSGAIMQWGFMKKSSSIIQRNQDQEEHQTTEFVNKEVFQNYTSSSDYGTLKWEVEDFLGVDYINEAFLAGYKSSYFANSGQIDWREITYIGVKDMNMKRDYTWRLNEI